MLLNFRQGVVKARLLGGIPDFLQQNQNNPAININITSIPLVVSATFGASNYLIQESVSVTNAWGSFVWNSNWGSLPSGPITYYLYWNIDVGTAKITRGYTPWAPITSSVTPTNPGVDEHWYDLTTNIMKVWNGSMWMSMARVFAGSWSVGTHLIVPSPLGTQVGITSSQQNILAGFILLGNDLMGIKLSNGTFLTSESDIIINQGNYTSPVQLEALSTQAVASEPIPAYSCITVVGQNQIGLAIANNVSKLAIGIVTDNLATGDTGKFIYSGMVFNQNWNWNLINGKSLYVGFSGEITQVAPPGGSVAQQIGSVISATSIFLMPGVSGIVGPMGPQADMSRLFPYDLSFFYPGVLNYASAVIGSIIVLREIDILIGAPTSLAKSMVPAHAPCTINIAVNHIVVGSVFFNTGSTVGIITMPATVLVAGDIVSIISPSTLDSTLADVMLTLTGYSRSIPL